MTSRQFYLLLLFFGTFCASQLAIWGCFYLYLVLKGVQ